MMTKLQRTQAGFTLVEIAIVLTIIAVLAGSGILALNGIMSSVRYNTTIEHERDIARAVAAYAQRRNSLPCPANPALNPITGVGINIVTSCNTYAAGATSAIGIVPYASLGLTQAQARDGYGRFITYAVNTGLEGPVPQHPILSLNIHNACRIPGLWMASVLGTNKNERKARFCCYAASNLNDLAVFDSAALTSQISPARPNMIDVGLPNAPLATTPATFSIQAAAIVLVSHGRNGFGSFLTNGTTARMAGPAAGRNNELENENYDRRFVSATQSDNPNNYFDDIVLWQTQEQLISAFGRDSCARP